MVIHSLRRQAAATTQRRRLLLLVSVMGVWALLLVARLLYLQVTLHEEFVAQALDQQMDVIRLAAERGDIVARDGETLATSIDLGSIYAHPDRLSDPRGVAELLAPILEEDEDDLLSLLSTDRSFVYLRRKARPSVLARAKEAVLEAGLKPDVWAHEEAKRYYPHRSLAAHVVGWVNLDNRGQSGVEHFYDDEVRGRDGTLNTLKDTWSDVVGGTGGALDSPTRGDDLVLTLDWGLQYAAEEALEKAVISKGAVGGSIVALDPESGEVLALASYPTFNPNRFDRAMERNATNQVVQWAFEPGSVFKVITASAALHEGVVAADEPIDCEGGRYRVANHTYRDWKFGFGVMPFRDVLANSSNVGTIKVCQRLDPESYFTWLRDFGFGSPTGIDLPGEVAGLLRPPERWSKLTQASMAFGQEIGATPLQLATAVGAIANGGLLQRPYVLRALRDKEGRTVRVGEPETRRRVLDADVAHSVAGIMEHVVATGTGKTAAIEGYRVAGKTSTAQKIDPATGRYTKYVAGFAGFLPVDDPDVVIVVMIDEPQRRYGHGGSRAAAPAFREVAETAIRILRIPPDDRRPVPTWVTEQDQGTAGRGGVAGGAPPPP